MPTAAKRRSDNALTPADRELAARLVDAKGLSAAAALLGVHREALARALAPVGQIRRGTVFLIRDGLAHLATGTAGDGQ